MGKSNPQIRGRNPKAEQNPPAYNPDTEKRQIRERNPKVEQTPQPTTQTQKNDKSVKETQKWNKPPSLQPTHRKTLWGCRLKELAKWR